MGFKASCVSYFSHGHKSQTRRPTCSKESKPPKYERAVSQNSSQTCFTGDTIQWFPFLLRTFFLSQPHLLLLLLIFVTLHFVSRGIKKQVFWFNGESIKSPRVSLFNEKVKSKQFSSLYTTNDGCWLTLSDNNWLVGHCGSLTKMGKGQQQQQ